MSQYVDFFYKPDDGLRRKRILDAVESKYEDLSKNGPTSQEETEALVNSIVAQYKTASDKANIFIHYAKKVASKFTVPVPKESIEIRQAVVRQDKEGSNNGDYITFDLFTKCVDIIENEATSIDYGIINDKVNVDPIGEERKIRARIKSKFANDDDLLLLLSISGQIAVLFLIHQITGLWRGSENILANPKVAGVFPVEPGSAIAEAVREIAVGFAVSTAVLGINDTLRFMLADEGTTAHSNKRTVIDGAIGAASQVDLPPLLEKSIKAMGSNDHLIILNYAVKYISTSQDQGYEFWLTYFFARRSRFIANRAIAMSPAISRKVYADKVLGVKVDGPLVAPEDILLSSASASSGGQSFAKYIASGLVDTLNSSVSNPSTRFLCVSDVESNSIIRFMNQAAQILDTKMSTDAICCLVRFLGGIDKDLLRKIRTILGIYLNANLNLMGLRLDNFLPRLLNWIKTTILRMIITLIHQIIDKIVNTLLKFLNDIALDLGVLLECPLILELIAAIMDSIVFIINDLEEIIDKFVIDQVNDLLYGLGIFDDSLLGTRAQAQTGLYIIHQKRTITQILRIIDRILAITERDITLCEEGEQSDGKNKITYEQVTNDLAKDFDNYLNIPDNVKGSYFKDAEEIKLDNGRVLPKYTDGVIRIVNPDGGDATSECLPVFGMDNINKILGDHARSKK